MLNIKYFINSSLTTTKRASKQEMQQGLVLDAVGAAVRGDRFVPVSLEEVFENLSNLTESNTRST